MTPTATVSEPWREVSLVAQGVWMPWDQRPWARPASIGGRDPPPAECVRGIARRNPKVRPLELLRGFTDVPYHRGNDDFST